jgi:hypothetical protein
MVWFSSEIYKIMSWKKEEYEDLKDLLVSIRLYYLIDEDSLYISTMCYMFQWIYIALIVIFFKKSNSSNP